MGSLPMGYGQYRHMPQQVASAVVQAPIWPVQCHPAYNFNTGIPGGGPGVETSDAHAPEGAEPSSPDQGNDRVRTRSPARSNKRPRGNKRPRCEWSDAETNFLIRYKLASLGNGGRRSKGKANCTDWDEISGRFESEFGDWGQVKSSDQIRRKWDTILKSHKSIKKAFGHKDYSQLADKEFDDDLGKLTLAIILKREWYNMIDQCQGSSQQPNCQTSGLLDSRMYVVSDQSPPTQRQACNQPPALQSASPGTGRNSPTHSQTTYDSPPFDSSGDTCAEIAPDNNHRQAENDFRNGAAPAVVLRQSEGQSAPTTFIPWIDSTFHATNLADVQNQAPTTQNEANNTDHPRLQNSSPDTTYNPPIHSQANHYRPLPGHTADTGIRFPSGDGHSQAENSQIGDGAMLQVMTEDRGQSDQFTIVAPSIDFVPTESTGVQGEAQQLGERRPLEQVDIPYFNSLSEITKSVLLDLIVCDIVPGNLRHVCEWLASLHDEDPINMMASVQELALHGLLDIQLISNKSKLPLQWRFSRMWAVNLEEVGKTYRKFVLSVIRKYPKHQIHLHIRHDGHRDLQKSVQCPLPEGPELFTRRRGGGGLVFRTSLQHQHLKDLCLYQCTNLLREVDLRNLPNLRSFTIQNCGRAVVTGWRYVTKLEWLKVKDCRGVNPEIEHLSSLKYLHLLYNNHNDIWDLLYISESGCQLQSLTIGGLIGPVNHYGKTATLDLEKLQSLSVCGVWFVRNSFLKTISVAHSLTELSFRGCYFDWYNASEFRVDLSALRHLSSLGLSYTKHFWDNGTHGVEELENLTYLNCEGSDLEDLPDLSRLNKLRWVNLEDTPFLRKLGSGDLPEWLSKVWEETVLTATEWDDSPASDIFYESEIDSEIEIDSESERESDSES